MATPADVAIDMDNAAQRVTLDVIGQGGFETDFGATADLEDGAANAAFDLMNAGGISLVYLALQLEQRWQELHGV